MSSHLTDALERAVPSGATGPALPDPHERLAHGRRGVRRRRLAVGGIVAAVAAAAVVVPSALVDRGTPQRADVADGSTPTPPPPATTAPDASYDPFENNEVGGEPSMLVHLAMNDGEVSLAPGVTVLDEVADPFARSGVPAYAATVEYRGRTWWALSHNTQDGGTYSLYEEPVAGLSIERWIRDYEVLNTSPGQRWLDLADDGSVTARDGAVVVSQQSPATVEQADPAAPSAVAQLEVDGGRICVISRRAGTGSSEELALPESTNPGCTDLPGWDYPGNPAS